MDGFLLSRLVAAWLLPPGGLFLGILAGLLLRRRWRRAGNVVAGGSLAVLVLLSLDPVASLLMRGLDRYPPLAPAALASHDPGAVVVLASARRDAPEYGGDTVAADTLERLRYGVRVHRASGLPLLFTGGSVSGGGTLSLAFLMKEAAVDDFRVPVAWLEEGSRNTWQNAQFSAEILVPEGIRRVVLVTHAYHLPRAMASFEAAGLDPLPAPVGVPAPYDEMSAFDWVPSTRALRASAIALHEYLGRVWYGVRYF